MTMPHGDTVREASKDSAGQASGSPREAGVPAWRSPAAWMRYLVPAVTGSVADLYLKAWAFPDGVPAEALTPGFAVGRNPAATLPPDAIIPHVVGFTTTVNQGAVFGTFQGHVALFLAFSLVALAVILWVFVGSRSHQWTVHLALGLITAGAIGNVYDRAVFHAVRDMLKFYVNWYPYIFNLADALLCVGVPLLILHWLFVKERSEKTA